MTNLAFKNQTNKEDLLRIAHKAMMPKNYHVQSVKFIGEAVLADAVNEADPSDEYSPRHITLLALTMFCNLTGIHGEMIDLVDNDGEPVSEYREEMSAIEYIAKHPEEVVTAYLNAGKDLKAC